MCSRDGLGKLCHLDLQYPWLQQMVRAGRDQMKKVPGVWNLADLMTKPLAAKEIEGKLIAVGMRFSEGRSDSVDRI